MPDPATTVDTSDVTRGRLAKAAALLTNVYARQPYGFNKATLTAEEVAAAQDLARDYLNTHEVNNDAP